MTAASRFLRWGRRVTGLVLLMAAGTPVYRMLATSESGLAGSFTVTFLDIHLDYIWAGFLLLLPVALIAAFFIPLPTIERATTRTGTALAHVRALHLALVLALCAGALAAAFALLALDGKPNQIDSIAQLMQARFWAEGRLSGPASDGGGFWAIQNALFTEQGWVSQYPPGHVAVLTLFLLVKAPWLAGPVMVALTVFFATLLITRLMPERPALARFAAIMCALSPFFLLVGGSFMNHITAAAGVTAGAWALLRAWQGRARWAIAAGFCFAYALTTRPLSALAMSAAVFLLLPYAVHGAPRLAQFGKMAALCLLGALPPMIALFAYNQHFFGRPTALGYEIALGPQMSLGLHRDPWGNWYGFKEAIAYTSADLMTLGVNLFETPISALFVIGAFLLVVRRLTTVERLLFAWAAAPVIANFFYWHHGLFMGPRMLHEASPAWAMLTAVAGVRLVERIPRGLAAGRINVKAGVTGALAGALAFGVLVLAPQRAASYGGEWLSITRIAEPRLSGPAIVFVHDAWMARAGMTLAAHGYRLDTVETLLRQNSTCAVQQLADFESNGDTANARSLLARLDTIPRATRLPRTVEIAPGDPIRMQPGETLTPYCLTHARSDSAGILDVAPLTWRGDLPGSEPRGILYVRDLGPARNAVLIAQHPERTPYLYSARGRSDATLYPYAEGMQRLWGDSSLHAEAATP